MYERGQGRRGRWGGGSDGVDGGCEGGGSGVCGWRD